MKIVWSDADRELLKEFLNSVEEDYDHNGYTVLSDIYEAVGGDINEMLIEYIIGYLREKSFSSPILRSEIYRYIDLYVEKRRVVE